MKNLFVTLLFLLTSFLGFGQSVSAPDSKSFLQSTNGQDGSGFSLSGFGSTETLLASISLVNPPSGTTFNLTTTTGLTAASGFTLSGNKTRLVVTGTMTNINTALASLKVNTGSVKGNVQLSVAATVNPTGFFYNGTNGHFYRPITATNDRTTYTNARARSLLTTFKGQTGYLVTITSADEDAFIFANVPATNVWFAATDEVIDGRWVIDAGPEKGTVMKTSNGQLTGNIQGVYNNWCGGEPNGSNGSENYAVAKWNGAACWNDLSNNWNNPYVIEYGTWTNPDDATFTEFYTNSVIHSNGDVLRAQLNFDFGPNIDETKFSAKLLAQSNNQYLPTTNNSRTLNGLGRVDMTNDLDTIKISGGGIRATTTTGEVEWCVIYEYDNFNQRYRIGIDSREVNGIVSSPSTISSLQLFDLWNGPVTFNSYDPNGWTEVYVYTTTQFNFSGSSFSSFIRAGNGFYGLRAEFTFSPIQSFKPHGVQLTTTNNMASLYNSIVTVSDVFLAFKELSNGGIFGNQSGLEFGNGIQFMNADVDGNGIFNEGDTYKLLQHLTGAETIGGGSTNLSDYIKLYTKSEYDAITKTNWYTKTNITRNEYTPLNLSNSTLLNNFNLNATWIGDVNLSHSAQQSVSGVSANSVRSMSLSTNSVSAEINASIIGEVSNDKVIITISLDPLQQSVVGTQFQLNYDNTKLKFEKVDFITKGNPMNYGTNRGSFVSIGSLITSGDGSLDKTTEYRIVFSPIGSITDILGLTSISTTDAVNKDGKQLKVKLN
jgi:hypothetical protein